MRERRRRLGAARRRPRRRSGTRLPMRVAFQDSCHLRACAGIAAEPRAMLDAIPGLERLEPAEQEICCGSAGIYNIVQPRRPRSSATARPRRCSRREPDAYASGNPGCLAAGDGRAPPRRPADAGVPSDRARGCIDPRAGRRRSARRGATLSAASCSDTSLTGVRRVSDTMPDSCLTHGSRTKVRPKRHGRIGRPRERAFL